MTRRNFSMHPNQELALEANKDFINNVVIPAAILLFNNKPVSQETYDKLGQARKERSDEEHGNLVGGLTELTLAKALQDEHGHDIGKEVLGLVAGGAHAKNVAALKVLAEDAGLENIRTFSQKNVRDVLAAVREKLRGAAPNAAGEGLLGRALGRTKKAAKKSCPHQWAIDALEEWLKRKAGGDTDVARERDEAVRLQKELLKAFTPSEEVNELHTRANDLRAQAKHKCDVEAVEAVTMRQPPDRVRAIYAEADSLERDAQHLDHQAAEKEAAEKEAFALEQERLRQENLAAAQTNPVVKADPNAKGNGNGVVDPVKTRERITHLKAEETRLVQLANEAWDKAQGIYDAAGLSFHKMGSEAKKEFDRVYTIAKRAEESADKAKAEVTTLEKLLAARPQPRKERQPKKASQPKPAAAKGGGLQEQQSALVAKILEATEAGNDALVGNLTRALELIGGAMPSASVH